MGCFCNPVVVSTSPPCSGTCLRVTTIRIGCDDGPSCGETVQINLEDYNDTSAGTNVKYKLTKTTFTGFSSVTLTEAGVLTFTVDSTFTSNYDYVIDYLVYEDGGLLSDTGYVYVCKKDNCKGVTIPSGKVCDPCDGSLSDETIDIEIT